MAFLIDIKHISCLGRRLGNENSRIQKSIISTTSLRIKPSQLRKANFFNRMPLLLGEQALLQHILVREALQFFGNKQFLVHIPVKLVPLE